MPSWARQKFENDGLSVAKGEVPGYGFVHVNGYNPEIPVAEVGTVWPEGGLYPWSVWSETRTITVVSTSALDTGSVVVTGLDADYNIVEEEIDFNGLTSGAGTQEFIRVNSAIYQNGDGTNAGNITLTAGGSTVGLIAIGFGQTLNGFYTVPAGKTGFITAGDFSTQRGGDAQIRFFVRPFGGNFRIGHMGEAYQSTYRYDFTVPLPIPEKSDIEVRASLVETNKVRVSCNFDITLIDNDKLRR
jgi:hypothetical protein